MRRRLLNLLTALSLVLCVAVVVLMLADADASREMEYVDADSGGGGRVWGAYCQDFQFYFGLIEGRSGTSILKPDLSVRSDRGWTRSMLHFWLIHGPQGRRWIGFGIADEREADVVFRGDLLGWRGVRVRTAMVPAWFVLAAVAVLPAAALVRRLRQYRRSRGGLCTSCGYDLRATPGRCPECGRESGRR